MLSASYTAYYLALLCILVSWRVLQLHCINNDLAILRHEERHCWLFYLNIVFLAKTHNLRMNKKYKRIYLINVDVVPRVCIKGS